MQEPVVIIGAGQAGAQAAASLRQGGYDGDIVLFGDEAVAPYQRPPLSKKYLSGELEASRLALRADGFWSANNIDLRSDNPVRCINPRDHTIELAGGVQMKYAKVLLATGTRGRRPRVEGADLAGVHVLRTIADVDELRPQLGVGKSLVIVGGGYIGLEVAAVCRTIGLKVTVLEAQARVLQRVVSSDVSDFFDRLHRGHGVDIRVNSLLEAIMGDQAVRAVRMADGAVIEADLVLLAVGAAPVTELAEACDLACDDGVVVDAGCRTSAPDIYAAGDCTRFYSTLYGRQVRLESVQNALDQAKAAAASIGGEKVTYDPVPWFWSDQYDIKLQIAGLSDGYTITSTEGSLAEGKFAVSYLDEGRLLAVDAINMPRAHMLARRAVGKPYFSAEDV